MVQFYPLLHLLKAMNLIFQTMQKSFKLINYMQFYNQILSMRIRKFHVAIVCRKLINSHFPVQSSKPSKRSTITFNTIVTPVPTNSVSITQTITHESNSNRQLKLESHTSTNTQINMQSHHTFIPCETHHSKHNVT